MLRRFFVRGIDAVLAKMSSSFLGDLKDVPGSSVQPEPQDLNSEPDYVSELSKFKERYERVNRRCQWYFQKIESIIKERDQWQSMFYVESRGHLAAQMTCEVALMESYNMLNNAVVELNRYREKENQPLLVKPYSELAVPPVGNHEKHQELIAKLLADAPHWRDYVAERDKFKKENEDATSSTG